MSFTDWERLARTTIATSSILRSVRTIVGRPVRSSSSKQFLPSAKRWCHLNTALRPRALSPYTYLIICNVYVADLPSFWQNLMFSRCSNCNILQVNRGAFNSFHNRDSTSIYTLCTHLSLACWSCGIYMYCGMYCSTESP